MNALTKKQNPQAGGTAQGASKTTLPENHTAADATPQAAVTFDYAVIGTCFAELSELPRWVPYALRRSEKRQKFDKIPHSGQHGLSTAIPEHWMTLAGALDLTREWRDLHGAGLVFTGGITLAGYTLIGLDFDNVDFGDPGFQATINVLDTYAETSPSGKGVRAFAWVPAKWAVKFADNLKAPLPGCDHCEIYVGSPSPRFLTVTFDTLRKKPIRRLGKPALEWLESRLKPREAEGPDNARAGRGKNAGFGLF